MLTHDRIFLQIIDISHISYFIYAIQLDIFLQHNQQNTADIYQIKINNIHPGISNT